MVELTGLLSDPNQLKQVTWPILVGAAAADSVNPCAFGVLIFLITYLLKVTKSSRQMILHGLTYIFAVFITYFVAGLVLRSFISSMNQYTVPFYILFGIIVLGAGIVEFRDFARGDAQALMAIRPAMKKKVEAMVMKISENKWMSAGLGFFVAMVELPCTGAVYIAVLAGMANKGMDVESWIMLLVYNLIFVLPLIIILILVYKGMTTMEFKKFYVRAKRWMRLSISLVLLGMGVWMLHNVGVWDQLYIWMFL